MGSPKFALAAPVTKRGALHALALNGPRLGQPSPGSNPLLFNARKGRIQRLDPTRTTLIRNRFEAEIKRRYVRLRVAVRQFIVELDALGLRHASGFIRMALPRPGEFEFRTDPQKLQAFLDWFRQQSDAEVLQAVQLGWQAPLGSIATGPWTVKYVESAYRRGLLNAYLASKQGRLAETIGLGDQTQEDFMRSAFGSPELLSKIQLLATRTFEELKGVNAAMAQQMNRILAQGLADGLGAKEIADQMAEQIDGMSAARALMIARTELIYAHAEGQLDAFDLLGVDTLEVMAEWVTAGDDRVCPLCSEREGQKYTIEEARGLIPLHPNCRCSWIPSVATVS